MSLEKIQKAIEQGYIYVKNEDGQVFKSCVNGIIFEGGEFQFILTYADRTTNPPRLQEYDMKQILNSNWALIKKELEPYGEEIFFKEPYDYEGYTKR